MRRGWDEFLTTLDTHCVPLLIFSAGIGDILEEIIKQKTKVTSLFSNDRNPTTTTTTNDNNSNSNSNNRKTRGKLSSHIHIISNFSKRSIPDGYFDGFIGDQVIHCMNKNESQIVRDEYSLEIANRKNIILLGDHIGNYEDVLEVA